MVRSELAQRVQSGQRILPGLLGLALLWMLWTKAQDLDWGMVQNAFLAIPASRWLAAAIATAASFWAIGQYDVVAHRHFRTGLPEHVARNAGLAAIAVGQTTGFGPAVGAALRWRLMPGLGHGMALRLLTFVTLGFLLAWGLLAGTVAIPVLAGLGWLALPGFALGGLALAALVLRYPRLRIGGRQLDLPSLPALVQLVGLAACDLLFAGVALYLLLPPDLSLPFLPMVAAFTLALGAGMLGGTPGGVGPFELTLIALMPDLSGADAAASLIAFRAVYYAAPCLIGAGYALVAAPCMTPRAAASAPPLRGPRAEIGIAAQTPARALFVPGAEACALRTPQTLMLFLGPTRGSLAPLLPELKRAARSENRVPCLYKLTDRDAEIARARGWHVRAFAIEGVIDAQRFSLNGSPRRQLRRFLRKAESVGLVCAPITDPDWQAMTEVHRAWEAAHGRERGLTMGRFCPLYLRDKPLYGAWLDGRLVAFVSGVETRGAIALDLMRHMSDLPQGVMHALVHEMIRDAAARGLHEVSLAALPHPDLPDRLAADCAGLARFKSSFAPDWRVLHIAAPNPALLALAALDIRLAILDPAPLARSAEDLWALDALVDPKRDTPLASLDEPLRHAS